MLYPAELRARLDGSLVYLRAQARGAYRHEALLRLLDSRVNIRGDVRFLAEDS